jgi:ribosome-interacting GTPase 1
MPLTLEESAALMNDQTMKGKAKVAMLRYCDTILIEADSTLGHTSRVRWAQQAMQQPEIWVNQLYPNVIMDPAIQEAGAAATDQQIQAATEAVINKTV